MFTFTIPLFDTSRPGCLIQYAGQDNTLITPPSLKGLLVTKSQQSSVLNTTEIVDLLATVGDSAFATALAIYRDVDEASDEAGRLIAAAATLIHRGENIEHPTAWAATSVRNELVNRIRKREVQKAYLTLEVEALMQNKTTEEHEQVLWDLLVDEMEGLTTEERAVLFGIISGTYTSVFAGMRAQGMSSGSYPGLRRKLARTLLAAGIIDKTEDRTSFARFGRGRK